MSRLLSLSPLQNRYPALHGLRFCAIVAVLQIHVTNELAAHGMVRHPGIPPLSQAFWFGMDLFFVLSGFLIGSMLYHQRAAARPARALARFWLRRAFRTFPLYYVVLTTLALTSGKATSLASLVAEYTYVSNYLPRPDRVVMSWGWSLCVEEHFYLLVPLVLWLLARVRSPRAQLTVLLALWASAFAARALTYLAFDGRGSSELLFVTMYVRTHTRFDTLVAGLILAHLCHHHEPDLRRVFERRLGRALAAVVALACLCFLMLPLPWRVSLAWWNILAWGTVTSLMYVAVVLPLLFHRGLVARALSLTPFRWAATLGYGVYLVHPPLMFAGTPLPAFLQSRLRWGEWPTLGASIGALLAASLAASYVLHLVVEKPMLALRDRLAPSGGGEHRG